LNIAEVFLSAANRHPNNIAIVDLDRSITYADLTREVRETAAYFKQKGISAGDRVLVFVPMGIDLYRIVLALFYIGATAVFLDEWVSKKRLEVCCRLADCKGFIGVFKAWIFTFISKELRQIPIKLRLKKRLKNGISITQVTPDSPALITFTTGSTGTPKAANRTHEFLKEQFDALLDEVDPKVEDVDMPVLPIVLFVNLGVGCTSVIADFKMTKPELINVSIIAEQIRKNSVTRITASPFFIRKLSEHAIEQGIDYSQIKKVFTGGAPVFPSEASLYVKAFPKSVTRVVYGSTEAEPISSIDATDLVKRSDEISFGLPVGRRFHKTKLKIVEMRDDAIAPCSTEELSKIVVKEGEIGEIIVSGPHVLKQYFKNEEAFRKNKIVELDTIWHRTGDSGLIKNDELFLTGRCKQLIKTGDRYLSPFIIEDQLQNIEGVAMGTMLKIKDQHILVVQSALDAEQLKQSVKDIPHDSMIIVDLIPRDSRHNSKIDYEELERVLTRGERI
jgi:acyl-CoA synthetase (AMP-forming)/AMP-acid ligase II